MGQEFVEMSIGEQYCLKDMIELPSDLERLNPKAWIIRRKMAYVRRQLPRKPYLLDVFVSSTTVNALLQLGFIEQASGEVFVVSKTGEEYYNQHLKP
jgi:hypothetical protein